MRPEPQQTDDSERRPERAPRPPRVQRVFVVERTERLSPHLVRVHLGGPDFQPFVDEADPERLGMTDRYVKIQIADPRLGLTPPFDLEELRATRSPDQLPSQRTYTVRAVDHGARTIAIDFVVHGDEGVAGPWAAAAAPGDLLALSGPGGGYRPSPDGEKRYLMIGDDSAIPAIAAALETMPQNAVGTAVIEVDSAEDELELAHPSGIELLWVHRAGAGSSSGWVPGRALIDAVQALPVPTQSVEVFAHGERGAMQSLRAVLQDQWGIERRAMSLSAYWAHGRAEDRFQAEKREPVGKIFTD